MNFDLNWRKAKASSNPNGCVELAKMHDGTIAMRDSKDPSGPMLIFTPHEIVCFLDGSKKGEFDDLI